MTHENPTPRRKIAGERTRRTPPPAAKTARETPVPSHPEPTPQPAEPSGEIIDMGTAAGSDAAGRVDQGGRVSRIPTWLLVGMSVLLAAAVAFDLIFAFRYQNRAEQADTASGAMTSAFNTAPASAEQAATQILGYDYKTLQQDAGEAETFMTAAYAHEFNRTVDDLLAAPAEEVKAHVEAKVMSSGTTAVSPGRVDVLLFVDQVSQTTTNADPQTALNRVVFTMVKDDNQRWLVDDITAL